MFFLPYGGIRLILPMKRCPNIQLFSKIGLRQNYRHFHMKKPNHSILLNKHRSGPILISICILLSFYFANKTIESEVKPIDVTVHKLEPTKDAETYEQGLFEASQSEESRQYENYRNSKLSSKNILIRAIYWLKFKVEDYLYDPIVIASRFLELSCIFMPIILLYPLCFFGAKDKSNDNIRSGALLWYRLLRRCAELAGPSFIKLGQWAASRTDIFSKQMCDELSVLHSNSRPHSLAATKRIISKSFEGIPFDEIFDEFNEKPVGVGAIAQVYIAKLSKKTIDKIKSNDLSSEFELKDSNRKDLLSKLIGRESYSSVEANELVAIKVLHPNVELKIIRDLKIMKFIACLINVIPTMEWLSLPSEVDQFAMLMKIQLDLRIEGLNLAKFRYNFRDRLDIKFPKPYLNFTTRNVLVEEYIHGVPLSKLLTLKENFGKNLSKEVSDKGIDSFLKMLILDNFVHADLHPGNMIIRFYKNELFKHEKEYKVVKTSNEEDTITLTDQLLELGDDNEAWCEKLSNLYGDGYHAEICFLDAGIVTELNETDRVNFIALFRALSEFDGYRAGELMIERSRTPETAINKEIFAIKVERLVNTMKARTFALGNISIGDLLDQVLGMVRAHHVRMEGDFVSVVVAILLLEGIGRQLDPDLDLFARFVYALLFDLP